MSMEIVEHRKAPQKAWRIAGGSIALALALLGPCPVVLWPADRVAAPPARPHWAWQAVTRPEAPPVADSSWAKTPLDRFVLARLEASALEPAPEASREELIRRASFGLIGLPPEPRAVDEFLADTSPDAWDKVVDTLLASPHYGERWGRHWLDLARFAETNGFEHDEARPDAWRYRDYVIRSLNADKPYDRFVEEQLAGDELFPEDPEALIATGFNLLGPDMTDASDQGQRRHNTLCDMTDTAGFVFLGVSLACARCHDHKFEPFLQADYYRLQAFFAPARFRTDVAIASSEERARWEAARTRYQALAAPIEEQVAGIEAPHRSRLRESKLEAIADEARAAHRTPEGQRTPAERELVEKTERLLAVSNDEVVRAMSPAERARREELTGELKRLEPQRPPPLPVALGLSSPQGKAQPTCILERGELCQPGDPVQPGVPAVLEAGAEVFRGLGPDAAGRRAALAHWITGPGNPLTARVIVNRVWQHHFGRGIVATPSDFGLRGERPTHPELLDWLAAELIAQGWSLKALHRRILLSAAYRQTSTPSALAARKDPENRLFSRQSRLRLEGEAIRDGLLAASGRLNRRMGGPGVLPPVPAGAIQGTNVWKASLDPADHARRSVYLFARRNLRFPFLEAFDFPDSNASCPRRERSTTATQALSLLNADEVLDAAAALAARLEREATTMDERIALVYRIVLSRRPAPSELAIAREFLASSPLRELCRALFNANEFVYVD